MINIVGKCLPQHMYPLNDKISFIEKTIDECIDDNINITNPIFHFDYSKDKYDLLIEKYPNCALLLPNVTKSRLFRTLRHHYKVPIITTFKDVQEPYLHLMEIEMEMECKTNDKNKIICEFQNLCYLNPMREMYNKCATIQYIVNTNSKFVAHLCHNLMIFLWFMNIIKNKKHRRDIYLRCNDIYRSLSIYIEQFNEQKCLYTYRLLYGESTNNEKYLTHDDIMFIMDKVDAITVIDNIYKKYSELFDVNPYCKNKLLTLVVNNILYDHDICLWLFEHCNDYDDCFNAICNHRKIYLMKSIINKYYPIDNERFMKLVDNKCFNFCCWYVRNYDISDNMIEYLLLSTCSNYYKEGVFDVTKKYNKYTVFEHGNKLYLTTCKEEYDKMIEYATLQRRLYEARQKEIDEMDFGTMSERMEYKMKYSWHQYNVHELTYPLY